MNCWETLKGSPHNVHAAVGTQQVWVAVLVVDEGLPHVWRHDFERAEEEPLRREGVGLDLELRRYEEHQEHENDDAAADGLREHLSHARGFLSRPIASSSAAFAAAGRRRLPIRRRAVGSS